MSYNPDSRRLSPALRFSAFVAAPAILLVASLVLFGTWSLWATARQVDRSIRERQANDVHLALGAVLDDLAQSQAGVAIWDPAYAEVQKARPDAEWLDKNVGVWLSYSSLSYLKQFKVDRIKIDKSFIKRVGRDQEAIAIVQAVIALGHAMNLSVTAEGVETSEQGLLLETIGCNELQGYLFSKALREEELSDKLADMSNSNYRSQRAGKA